MKTLVMKFGGAAVATPEHFSRIAALIESRMAHYQRIAVVVSAMGDTTNQLIALAKQVNPDPPRREYDMLVTVGERVSSSLLAMALAARELMAISFTGSQAGIITCGRHTDARIVDVRPSRILPYLEAGKIIVVAGFQGVSRDGEITTLGRGGSDTTAVALGVALGAEKVEFFKDVPGIFAEDPKRNPEAAFLDRMTYEGAWQLAVNGAKVLHARCIKLAGKNGVPLHVRSFYGETTDSGAGTVITQQDRPRSLIPLYEDVEHD